MRNFSTEELKHQTKHIYLKTYLKGTTSESDLTTEVKMIFYLNDRIISSGKKKSGRVDNLPNTTYNGAPLEFLCVAML